MQSRHAQSIAGIYRQPANELGKGLCICLFGGNGDAVDRVAVAVVVDGVVICCQAVGDGLFSRAERSRNIAAHVPAHGNQ